MPIRALTSHHTARSVGYSEVGRYVGLPAEDHLKLICEARSRGVEIYLDVLPWEGYGAGNLASNFLDHEHQEKVFDEEGKLRPLTWILEKMRDPEWRQEAEKKAREEEAKWKERVKGKGTFGSNWYSMVVNRSKNFPEYVGKRLAEIAEMRGTDPITAVADIFLKDDGNTFCGSWHIDADTRELLKDPSCMVSTDSQAIDGKPSIHTLGSTPAVRDYGSFPRVLGTYVREERLFPLEEAVRKVTSLPAQAFGIVDRGRITEGMWGDITIFNPNKIAPRCTYAEPRQYCAGIEYVLVNGHVAMDKTKLTGALGGKVLIHKT